MKNRFHRHILYYCLRALMKCAQVVPRTLLLGFATVCGNGLFVLLRKESAKTVHHLQYVYLGKKSSKEIRTIARHVFVNLAKNLVDWILIERMSKEKFGSLISIEGREKIERVLARGKGVVAITAHIGNWEYLALYFAQFIQHAGVDIVAREIYYKKYDDLIVGLRKNNKVETIYTTDSPKNILRALKNNRVVGMLPDQNVRHLNGVSIDFFGRKSHTLVGPVALARASGAGVVPAFLIRQKDNKYTIYIEDEIDLVCTDDKKNDIRENTIKWNSIFEEYILKYPDQWVWMHDRWKNV
ncbi:MAG: lysophospholipid acyltransferase family protein [Candidatus Ancaeobacter aquaticus]|nr:lysophospholipid acyltransferase family protein [Candidatus Ancaeobacter aquaticus]